MQATVRARFDREIDSVANDPYGSGSTAIRERDYRQAVVGGCITVYYVSDAVKVVSVTRVQEPP
nr:hypothetical protein [Streptomyces sp. SID3343]